MRLIPVRHPTRLAKSLAVTTVAVAIMVPVARGSYYEMYYDEFQSSRKCWNGGDASISHAWNYLSWNETQVHGVCYNPEASPHMGLTYMRTDYSTIPYRWFALHPSYGAIYFYDGRNIAYGRAICRANWGNGAPIYVGICRTGNNS